MLQAVVADQQVDVGMCGEQCAAGRGAVAADDHRHAGAGGKQHGLVAHLARIGFGADFGGAAASITAAKRARLVLAARHWLQRHGERPCRFDCVLIEGAGSGRIEWLRDAFTAD